MATEKLLRLLTKLWL